MADKKIKNKTAKSRMKAVKNIAFWFFAAAIFFGILGFSLISNIRIGNVRTQYLDRIADLQKQIKEEEEKKALLEKGLSQVGKEEYLEEIARKQFGLKAPGEEVAVVLKDQQGQSNNSDLNEGEKSFKSSVWNPLTWWRWIIGK